MQSSRLEKLLEFLQNEPEDEFLKYALATEYLRLKQTEKALHYYREPGEQTSGLCWYLLSSREII